MLCLRGEGRWFGANTKHQKNSEILQFSVQVNMNYMAIQKLYGDRRHKRNTIADAGRCWAVQIAAKMEKGGHHEIFMYSCLGPF